jgi:hypothetical protein
MMRTKRNVANSDSNTDAVPRTGTVSALFRDTSEADGAIAELHLRGFSADSIDTSVHAWTSQAEAPALDDVTVVFDSAIPPDEPMGGGRIMGVGADNPLDENNIARAADTRIGSTMESTVRLTVRVGEADMDLVRTILAAHGGEPGAC